MKQVKVIKIYWNLANFIIKLIIRLITLIALLKTVLIYYNKKIIIQIIFKMIQPRILSKLIKAFSLQPFKTKIQNYYHNKTLNYEKKSHKIIKNLKKL